jgi:hypothetical protein
MSDQVSAVRARVEQALSEVLFKHGFLRGDGIIAQLVEAALRAAPAVSREASVPLLIDQLADRLEDWAQNEEMIDQFFLGHGKDCNEAAKLLRALSSAPGERT